MAGPDVHPAGDPRRRAAGVVVAHDVKNGKTKPIYGMGRLNHENNVAIPGFDELVVLSGDDTFQTNAAGIVPAVHVHGGGHRRALGRRGHACTRSSPTERTTTTSTSSPARRSRAVRPGAAETSRRARIRRRPRADTGGRLPELPGTVRRAVGATRTGRSGSSTSGATKRQHAGRR